MMILHIRIQLFKNLCKIKLGILLIIQVLIILKHFRDLDFEYYIYIYIERERERGKKNGDLGFDCYIYKEKKKLKNGCQL